jgi:phosphoribosyl 1,2-cyclic phosphate phosphodiesterase
MHPGGSAKQLRESPRYNEIGPYPRSGIAPRLRRAPPSWMSMSPCPDRIEVVVLGTGTSVGVPMVGCQCAVCLSGDPRDRRLRCSILIRHQQHRILIDTTPDFRYQALRAGIERLDAILFTHAHADHVMGLDDVRPYNFWQRAPIPAYGSPETVDAIQRIFAYIFNNDEKANAVPRLEMHVFEDDRPFELLGLEVVPIRVHHGRAITVHGFRVGGVAYLTDHNQIPADSIRKLEGLDVLFLDALRHRPHPTHSTVERSLEYARQIGAGRTYFTHISHDLPHAETERHFPPDVRLAFDGLTFEVRARI